MTDKNNQSAEDAAKLRGLAESKFTKSKKKTGPLPATDADTRHLIHDLQVHQIELEMQNDELMQARVETEASLRQYTDLYDSSPVGYFTLARNGTIHEVNLAGVNLLGVERSKLIKRRFGVFVSNESRPAFNVFLDKVFMSGSKENCEIALWKDGAAPLWVHMEASTEVGQRDACHAVVSNITESKRAKDELRDSEIRYRRLFEASRDGVLILNAETGLVLDVNPFLIEMLGFSKEEICGKELWELGFFKDIAANQANFLDLQQKGVIRYDNLPLETAGRRKIRVEFVSNVYQEDHKKVIQCNIRDVTERKQAELEIASLAKFPSENPNPVLRLSGDGCVMYANEASEAILGLWGCAVGGSAPQFWRDLAAQTLVSNENKTSDIECEGKVYSMFATPVAELGYMNVYGRDITARKQAEEALAKSELKFRWLYEYAPVAYHILTPEGTITDVNRRWCDLLGYRREEALGKAIFDFVVEEEREASKDSFEKKKQIMEPYVEGRERNFKTKDGTVRTFKTYDFFVLDKRQNLSSVQTTIEDITERKRAEEAIQASVVKYRSIFENVQDVYYETSFDGTVLEVSPSIETISQGQYRRADLIGKSMYEFYADTQNRTAIIAALQKTGSVSDFEITLKNRDSSLIQCSISAKIQFNVQGNPEKIVGSMHDITGRKLAEEALRETNEYLENLLNYANAPIIVWDPQFKITRFNHAFETLAGRYAQEVLGKSLEILFPPAQITALMELSQKTLAGERWEIVEVNIQHIDGSIRTVLWNSATLFSADSKIPIATIAQGQDITERKRGEERIQRQLEHLTALSNIDRVISSNFDLRISLSEILAHVTKELGIDAADILILNSNWHILEFAAESGFRSKGLRKAEVRLDESYAGRAVRERQLIQVPDLRDESTSLSLTTRLKGEDFVCYYGVPLVVKGEVKGVLEVFHRSALEPDTEWFDFLNTLAGQATIAIENATLFESLQRSNSELFVAYDATIEGWSHALDLRDKETEGHTQRVTEMTEKLASSFRLSEAELRQVRWGALLHDIGKMGVPDGILLKPGPLTDDEWVAMKKHPVFAYDMLSPIRYLQLALDIPYCHHEKWDGTGYPRGLKGEQIPLTARIFAVVDVWDALISDRPYRKAWSEEKARQHIQAKAGTHFDPQVVKKFFLEHG